jgi:opacity protein-like surface antigen
MIAWPAGVCYLFDSFYAQERRQLMFIPSVRRSFYFLLVLSLASACSSATAQTIKGLEGAVSIFGQFTGSTSGNCVRDSPTDSLGVLATARQSLHPWLGWEVNYSYTRFSERYTTPLFPVTVQNNMHEVTAAYLLQGPSLPFLGFQPFAAVGAGGLLFLPTTAGGQRYNQQWRVPFLYEFGVNYPLLTSHLGLRLQYRGLLYKAPDYNASLVTTGARRQTSEPSIGAYFRF